MSIQLKATTKGQLAGTEIIFIQLFTRKHWVLISNHETRQSLPVFCLLACLFISNYRFKSPAVVLEEQSIGLTLFATWSEPG